MCRSKTYLAAIALAIGLTGAQAQTAPHESLGPKGVLTAARQKLLLATISARGKLYALNVAFAAPLGLVETEAENLRQIALKDEANRRHVYMALSDGGFLVAVVDTVSARNYRFNADARLVAAVSGVKDVPTALPLSDAKRPAHDELKYWADIADQLQDGK